MLDSIIVSHLMPLWPMVLKYHLLVLFAVSFLASTIVPLGSEWLVIALLAAGLPKLMLVLVATLGNSLGGLTLWYMGAGFARWYVKARAADTPTMLRARDWFVRYGSWSLLLSWLPVIGDPLCFVAGSLRINLLRFVILVATGKFLRYVSLVFATDALRLL